MLTDWVQELSAALDITPPSGPPDPSHPSDPDADLVNLVLDLARDAAHAVDRPAAPLTTFLVGYAAAQRGGGATSLAACAAVARDLAATWEHRAAGGTTES
ncbi:DUF6457 domain-containing protein [Actinopolymorpha sp. B9G3]|uniref:DUF6457 domain-containing protein n=1 Tax=Actinopolymorpha sp. B9G3 TaxID=3158970 RepID=UPI0032D910E2